MGSGQSELYANDFLEIFLTWSGQDLASETVEDLGCWNLHHKTWEAESVYLEPPPELNLGQ